MKRLSEILIYTAIVLSGVWLLLLSLGMFDVINLTAIAGKNFNYIWALVIVIVGMALYVGLLFVERIKSLSIPAWFKNLFYIAFFVFTNVYYFFSVYSTIWGVIIFDMYLAVLLNILSVSLFYNSQKDNKNQVKTTEKFLVFTCFCYSATGALVIEVLNGLVRMIVDKANITNTLSMFVSEACAMLLVSFMFALAFALSMRKSKQLINNCLIKVDTTSRQPKVKRG